MLGAGKIAEVTVRHLLSQKAGHLVVLNRTPKKAEDLAKILNGVGGSLEFLEDELLKADIVICSTTTDKPLIHKELMERIMGERRQRSLYFIDIAVPRNVHPGVHDLDNVYVYNIDDLKDIVDENMARRTKSIESAEDLIKKMTQELQGWIAETLQGRQATLHHNPPVDL